MKFPINTTKIAQYAALAANNSCLAALVNRLIAALNSSVNTINTPTALNVFRVFMPTVPRAPPLPDLLLADEVALVVDSGSAKASVLVRRYIVTTGTTRRMKMTKVMRMLTSLSMRELL